VLLLLLLLLLLMCSLESEREALAPHVAHWQTVQQQEAQLLSSRLQLLQDHQDHGTKLMQRRQQQVRLICSFTCICS
jgi:outer membrane biogenesis lipoprotein LolB